MGNMKARDIRSALTKKGFVEDSSSKHIHLIFWSLGKKTGIWTVISHSNKEIFDELISSMAKQTKLDKKDFLSLVDCSLSQDDYEKLVKEFI